jgi:hypothetical protein
VRDASRRRRRDPLLASASKWPKEAKKWHFSGQNAKNMAIFAKFSTFPHPSHISQKRSCFRVFPVFLITFPVFGLQKDIFDEFWTIFGPFSAHPESSCLDY